MFFGTIMTYIYQGVESLGLEPEFISYFGITILVITVLFKLITIPVTLNSMKSQEMNQKLQPKMKEIQNKYKNDPQQMNMKMAELYKEHDFNPMSGCLPMLLQFFLIIAMFGVMREPDTYMFGGEAVPMAKHFFWINDLSQPDPLWYGLPLINGIAQFLYMKLMTPTPAAEGEDPMQGMGSMMQYMMPLMIFFFSRNYQAGLALYWAFGNIIEIISRSIINKRTESVKEV